MLTVRLPRTYAAEREYAARVLLEEFLGVEIDVSLEERADTEITDGTRSLVCADGLFATPAENWLREPSLPARPVVRFVLAGTPFAEHPERELPVLYGVPSWREDRDKNHLGVDVFGSSFFLLTRYEELAVHTRDDRDRFPAAASLLVQERLARRPLVNEYVELLWLALRTLWPSLERRRHEYRFVPSHDVDWPLAGERTLRRMVRRAAADVVRNRDPLAAARRVVGLAARALGTNSLDVNNTFEAIMDASEARGLASTFFFIADRRTHDLDGDYSIDDPWLRRLLRTIHARGHEIGLHASYTTPFDPEQTRLERETLRRVLEEEGIEQERLGSRQHYLRWANPQTWRNCAEAGLDYDASVGFAEDIGFRAGTCFEYPVFDLEQRLALPLREQPLVVMEGALVDRLGLSHEAAVDAVAELRRTCRRYGGVFTLLWHNSRLVHRADRRLYQEALSG